jgi:hypothetical protein
MEWLFGALLQNLSAARWLGWAMFSAAGAAIGLGLRFGRVFHRATRAFGRAGVDQELTLTKLYPDWPTWWIPESPEGFVTWAIVGGLGACLALTAKSLQRQIR